MLNNNILFLHEVPLEHPNQLSDEFPTISKHCNAFYFYIKIKYSCSIYKHAFELLN